MARVWLRKNELDEVVDICPHDPSHPDAIEVEDTHPDVVAFKAASRTNLDASVRQERLQNAFLRELFRPINAGKSVDQIRNEVIAAAQDIISGVRSG